MTSAVNHAHLTIYQLSCARITLTGAKKKRRFFGQNRMCETKLVHIWLLFYVKKPLENQWC